MAKKRKIKKNTIIIIIVAIIVVVIGSIYGVKFYQDYKYKQTYEYKLIEYGYDSENAKKLVNFYKKGSQLDKILTIPKNDKIIDFIGEKYYIDAYLDRYLAYYEENQDMATKDIVSLVNVNRDYDYFEHDINADTSNSNLLLVNKYYKLSEDFEPANLVTISSQYAYANNQITAEANDAYVSMWHAAKESGFQLIVNSSYRNYADQEDVYNSIKQSKGEREADKVAARPGYSEHQSGLAIDVFEINNQLTGTFKDSPAYTWLKENAYKFGFIERYPEDKENITGYSFESWHWRYVGEDVAKIIYNENITYDEYYAYYIENA